MYLYMYVNITVSGKYTLMYYIDVHVNAYTNTLMHMCICVHEYNSIGRVVSVT